MQPDCKHYIQKSLYIQILYKDEANTSSHKPYADTGIFQRTRCLQGNKLLPTLRLLFFASCRIEGLKIGWRETPLQSTEAFLSPTGVAGEATTLSLVNGLKKRMKVIAQNYNTKPIWQYPNFLYAENWKTVKFKANKYSCNIK